MKDLYNNAPPVDVLAPISKDINADGETELTSVDRKDAQAVAFSIMIGAQTTHHEIADDHVALGLMDSADDSTFAIVATADMRGWSIDGTTRTALSYEDTTNGYFKQLDAEADANKIYEFEYIGTKRYVEVVLYKVATGSTAILVGVMARLITPRQAGEDTVFPPLEG